MTRISFIENAGPDRRARRLVFDDDTEPMLTAAAVVKVLSLAVDDEVEPHRLDSELTRVGRECAHERVLRLLGYRDRSEHELGKRLIDDGYPQPVVDELVARFMELGYVDDARFAAQWTASRQLAGYGATRIERELRMKGIEPSLAAAAARSEDDEVALDRARALIARLDLSDHKVRQKAFARLVRKGFSSSVAGRAIGTSDTDC